MTSIILIKFSMAFKTFLQLKRERYSLKEERGSWTVKAGVVKVKVAKKKLEDEKEGKREKVMRYPF